MCLPPFSVRPGTIESGFVHASNPPALQADSRELLAQPERLSELLGV